jgi:GT2 family glycosyltransferase
MINKKNRKVTESKARELFDSLFHEKKRVTSVPTQYMGNLDTLQNRTLSGWIVDENDLDSEVAFEVLLDNTVVGAGVANILREDLVSAGYGNGRHGFLVGLSSRIYSTGQHELTLREKESGVLISTNRFPVSATSDCVGEVVGFGVRVVHAQIICSGKAEYPRSVEILVDGTLRLPCALTNKSAQKGSYEAALPDELFDGRPHSYEIIANDANCSSTAYIDILNPVVTPEEHIVDSLGHPGYIGLPRSAGYRYESIALGIEQALSQTDLTAEEKIERLSRIDAAHAQLTGGMVKKRHYEKLTLPRVDDPVVSIIVPAMNKFEITYHCIASLILAYNKTPFEVILVDDASTDETAVAEEVIENLIVVRNEENLGFVRSNNLAVSRARGEYICLLNNDTEVTPVWLDEALDMFSIYNNVGAVGCKLVYPDGVLQEAGGLVWGNGAPWNYGKNKNASHPGYNYARNADYLSAAALFVSKHVWDEVGGFSEEFVPAYYEDTDLAFKIRESGYRTLYCPTSVVVHFEGKSNGTSTKEGVKQYQDVNSKKFRSKWFKAYKNHGEHGTDPHLEVDRDSDFRVLVLDADTPRRNRDAGSYAAFQEMKLMMELGCKLTFIPSNFAHMGVHTEYLQKLGVECIYYPFYQSVRQFLSLRGEEFDAVFVTRYKVAANNIRDIRELTDARIIFNNADLHFLREVRENIQKRNLDFTGPLVTRDEELEVIEQVDVAVCYTEAEKAVITSHVMKEENILRCPWVVKTASEVPSFASRQNIAFLGGYRHKPNVEAVEYFCTNVMPRLRKKLPEVVFHVYGSHMPDEFRRYESDNVKMIGYVENVEDVHNTARLFVSPLLSGAGLKGKVIECMAAGLPSVISPVSAEGTGLVHSQSAFIPDTVDEWCEYVYTLYTDEALWNKVSENALSLAESLYSPCEGARKMKKILDRVDVYSEGLGNGKFKEYVK